MRDGPDSMAAELIENILSIAHESKVIEFKRIAGKKVVSKILETIVAMANTDGGNIFLGVDDPEIGNLSGRDRIVGIEEDPKNMDMLMQGLSDITPHLIDKKDILLSRDYRSGKTIGIIYIPKATRDFHQLGKKVFVRQHTGNRELSPYEYADMIYAKGFKKAE